MSVSIFNTIGRPDGEKRSGATVAISVTWDPDLAPFAVDPENDLTIDGTSNEIAGTNGYWITSLPSNEVILPAGSLYKIVETYGSTVRTYYVDVPESASPLWVWDILAAQPAWEA